ncbi:MAG: 4Fe-4S binding protein [Betaproteobacteria bacterium]
MTAKVVPRGFPFAAGEWLRAHGMAIRSLQWVVVAIYLVLLILPAALPLPPDDARALSNITVFAQWAFWGVWWPFVLLSMLVAGRTWCGIFCPEGTLTEAASKFGLALAVPRWLKWAGWPFVAFTATTIFGQLVSVYQYPKAALLVLGGSTLAAIAVGWVYGREKRVWCRHLCPVNGVFAVLSRLSPLHYRVDSAAWRANAGHIAIHPVNCAPLVRIRRMTGPSECHMCGRCSGHLGAIALSTRMPNEEIASLKASAASPWDALLIVFGMLGLALGAFQWSVSPWFVAFKLVSVGFIVDHGPAWLLSANAPWWLLTNYPEAGDVFTWLDGALIIAYIGVTAIVMGGLVTATLWLSARLLPGSHAGNACRLAYALTPLAGLTVFLGLWSLTTSLAKAEGIPLHWVPAVRLLVLSAGAAWSVWLAWRQLADAPSVQARWTGILAFAAGVGVVVAGWSLLLFRWT